MISKTGVCRRSHAEFVSSLSAEDVKNLCRAYVYTHDYQDSRRVTARRSTSATSQELFRNVRAERCARLAHTQRRTEHPHQMEKKQS